jgi:hypothetical protein
MVSSESFIAGRALVEIVDPSSLFAKDSLLKVPCGLREVGGRAEVAPIIFVGAEGEDVFALGGEAEVGVDDGEDAVLGEHREKARRDDVDAGEGEREELLVLLVRRFRG